jgi:uncharacterized repeat protein (TIGR03803 family)
LYGTTFWGGASGYGTVFRITPSGTLTTLYSFCSPGYPACTDGYEPTAGLVQAANGDFYGTTVLGGPNDYGDGTVFKITPSGMLTTLYSFCSQSGCTDGQNPFGGLVQAPNGDFYGTTTGNYVMPGTVFKITPNGTLTTLHSFCSQSGCPDGAYPGGLVATNGDVYGITTSGGANNGGTIFKITRNGTLTTLYSFCSQSGCPDGYGGGSLVQATNGDFYGTTSGGGRTTDACNSGCGTVFKFSVGLGPFVETQPTFGKVGAAVRILGTNLAGVSSVAFNGAPAPFGVSSNSETEITATVPVGASTGNVTVVTPSGTLSSNVPFRVRP